MTIRTALLLAVPAAVIVGYVTGAHVEYTYYSGRGTEARRDVRAPRADGLSADPTRDVSPPPPAHLDDALAEGLAKLGQRDADAVLGHCIRDMAMMAWSLRQEVPISCSLTKLETVDGLVLMCGTTGCTPDGFPLDGPIVQGRAFCAGRQEMCRGFCNNAHLPTVAPLNGEWQPLDAKAWRACLDPCDAERARCEAGLAAAFAVASPTP